MSCCSSTTGTPCAYYYCHHGKASGSSCCGGDGGCCCHCGGGAAARLATLPLPLDRTYALATRRARQRAMACLQQLLLVLLMVLGMIWIGAQVETNRADAEPSTVDLYTTTAVCAGSVVEQSSNVTTTTTTTGTDNFSTLPGLGFQSYPSMGAVPLPQQDDIAMIVGNTTTTIPSPFIAHCGDCGACSNPHDVRIYDDTHNTLFGDAVTCAKQSVATGRRVAHTCLQEAVGFTIDCEACWVENIMCNVRNCLFVCLWHTMFSQIDTGEDSQALNRCTYCDEKRCGRAFVTCAGANRRRTGIRSDIERDDATEVCTVVTGVVNGDVNENIPWWRNKRLQELWDKSTT